MIGKGAITSLVLLAWVAGIAATTAARVDQAGPKAVLDSVFTYHSELWDAGGPVTGNCASGGRGKRPV
jgi:hypothetical protein